MIRYDYEESQDKLWEKGRELTAFEAARCENIRAESVRADVMPYLHALTTAVELRELAHIYQAHVSQLEYRRFLDVVERMFGPRFMSRASLPLERPRLALAS